VTARARTYAEGKLEIISGACFLILSPPAKFKNSKFDNDQDLTAFTESFDTGLKEIFSDSSKLQFVRFGSWSDNDARCDVRGGKFCLQG